MTDLFFMFVGVGFYAAIILHAFYCGRSPSRGQRSIDRGQEPDICSALSWRLPRVRSRYARRDFTRPHSRARYAFQEITYG